MMYVSTQTHPPQQGLSVLPIMLCHSTLFLASVMPSRPPSCLFISPHAPPSNKHPLEGKLCAREDLACLVHRYISVYIKHIEHV